MSVEDDANDDKEVNVALNATHLKVIPGSAPAARGNPASAQELESLFREHHDRVFRTAYRITGSVVDAEPAALAELASGGFEGSADAVATSTGADPVALGWATTGVVGPSGRRTNQNAPPATRTDAATSPTTSPRARRACGGGLDVAARARGSTATNAADNSSVVAKRSSGRLARHRSITRRSAVETEPGRGVWGRSAIAVIKA